MILANLANEIAIEANLKQFLIVLLVSLTVATLSQSLSFFRQIPYTLLLVIAGLCLAFLDVRLVNLSPELILLIFLPPLLFEAAWNLQWPRLKKDLIPISIYAVLGVVISVAGVALSLEKVPGISLATALLVGASVSATDPVSVIALFRELGVDKRLSTLMEGESLFNDGIAVVAFTFLLGFSYGSTQFSLPLLLIQFLTFVGVGVGVGSLIGFGISYITQRFDLPYVEQSATLVSAYGAYLIAEDFGGSGVIAVVITGLILGNFGSRIGMNPRTRLVVTEFWEFIAFFVNSIVFLLIGDQISFSSLGENLVPISVAITAVILTRALAIYGLGGLSNWLAKSHISLPEQTILWWGGLRGSVSIALALSVPENLPGRSTTIAIVFAIVLFTLLVQGLTTKPLLEKLGLIKNQVLQAKYLQLLAQRSAIEQVLNRVENMATKSEIKLNFQKDMAKALAKKQTKIEADIKDLQEQNPDLRDIPTQQLTNELIDLEADTYARLIRAGKLKEFPELLMPEMLLEKSE